MEKTIIHSIDDLESALELVWKVFLKFEAPYYSSEGVDEFYRSIHNEAFINNLNFIGAYRNKKLIGVGATRINESHIALLFVDEHYHYQGIGRLLCETMIHNSSNQYMTVNASTYGIDFYHKLNFIETDVEQEIHGIKFTPMKYSKGDNY